MEHLDIILILMALLAGLYSVAEKIGLSYPILLVVAGLCISLIPGLPKVALTPDVAFLLFLPPLLFDAARHTSWHDFKQNRDSIGALAIGLVLFTTAGVAIAAHYLIPGFTWPLAFLLGAIVSPPDAVAATAATKGLNLPKRLVAVLEGESLVNDATALIAYRYAIAAVMSGTFVLWSAAMQFVLVALGGIFVGVIVGAVFAWVLKKYFDQPAVETIITLMLPFIAYVGAEHLHVSGVLAAVATGLIISWKAPEIFSFQTRLQMNSFWETVVFLLNGFVFILIGLQLPMIVEGFNENSLTQMIGYGLMISLLVIVIRMVWIYPTAYIAQLINRMRGRTEYGLEYNKHLFIIGWSGMRGVVSLATALAIPLLVADGSPFPMREEILFITFIVILVTLVFQGLTLPYLIKYLGVSEAPGKAKNEERRLRLALANSARIFINEQLAERISKPALAEASHRVERQIAFLNGMLRTEDEKDATWPEEKKMFMDYLNAEKEIIEHQRARMIDMHKRGVFSAETLRKIEQDLDSRSLTLQGRMKAAKR